MTQSMQSTRLLKLRRLGVKNVFFSFCMVFSAAHANTLYPQSSLISDQNPVGKAHLSAEMNVGVFNHIASFGFDTRFLWGPSLGIEGSWARSLTALKSPDERYRLTTPFRLAWSESQYVAPLLGISIVDGAYKSYYPQYGAQLRVGVGVFSFLTQLLLPFSSVNQLIDFVGQAEMNFEKDNEAPYITFVALRGQYMYWNQSKNEPSKGDNNYGLSLVAGTRF